MKSKGMATIPSENSQGLSYCHTLQSCSSLASSSILYILLSEKMKHSHFCSCNKLLIYCMNEGILIASYFTQHIFKLQMNVIIVHNISSGRKVTTQRSNRISIPTYNT